MKKRSLIAIAALAAANIILGQTPDKFTNLQYLPTDITKPELISVMRGYSGMLGVRCLHCHIGTDGEGFTDVVFPADDREAKKIARVMAAMTEEINRTISEKTERPLDELTRVKCSTCHKGTLEPRYLRTELEAAYETDGAEALLTLYKDRRKLFYGLATYDFTPNILSNLAEEYSKNEEFEAAIMIAKANTALYPESNYAWLILAKAYFYSGNKTAAITSIRRSIALDPENEYYKRQLQKYSR